jgi:uncharacterized NAD(P)/FAD-binding protein YdhS
MTYGTTAPVVAIIGGGFTGAAVAYHLASQLPEASARVFVFEPRERLGAGLAYDTDEKAHRINVPAARMTLIPGDDEHFQRWLTGTTLLPDDPDAFTPEGHIFPRRGVFGRYVAAQLEPLLRAGRVQHRQSRVLSVDAMEGGRWSVASGDGQVLTADIVVLATSHPKPQAPSGMSDALVGHPRYVADTTEPQALAAVRPGDRVLVVGAGLTAADVIATLVAEGHKGEILAVSRRGLRSRGHNLVVQDPFGDFVPAPGLTAGRLLRQVRRAVSAAADAGVTWHAVFDRLRAQGGEIWRALTVAERRRVVRYLRPYWDVHRFRIAPQVEAVIEQQITAGSLSFRAASIASVSTTRTGDILVGLRKRRAAAVDEERFDAVVVTTGPGHGAILDSQPFLSGLSAAGLVRADPVGLGLDVSLESRAIGRGDKPTATLYVAGPLARGTFGELMGLPQVTEHARFVADRIAEDLQASAGSSGVAGQLRAG